MSRDEGAGTRPIRTFGAVPFPSPEEVAAVKHGVIFYRISEEGFSRVDAIAAVIGIYRLATGTGRGAQVPPGTYEMRVGLRLKLDEGGRYWVGFNHVTFGMMFQRALLSARQRPFRATRLPGADPNRELPIVNVEVLEKGQRELQGGRPATPKPGGGSPFADLFSPPAASTEPVPTRTSKEIMGSARQQLLGGFRGRRGRGKRGGSQQQ